MDIDTAIYSNTQSSFYYVKYCVFVSMCFIIFPFHKITAQTNDFGGNLGIELSKDISRSAGITFSQELRFNQNLTHYSRSETELALDYSFFRKKAKFGIGYAFLNKENNDFYYENQHRFMTQLSYKQQLSKWKLSWRGKLQSSYRNENIGDYKVNPKYYYKNKFQLNYKITNSRFEPFLSSEFYCSLNDLEGNKIDKIRTSLGFDYIFSPKASIEFFGRMDKDVQVKDPLTIYSLGIFYKYEF